MLGGAAYVSPTLDRPQWHEPLYRNFAAQTAPVKRLYVLDESQRPSAFFSRLKDPRVAYVHRPGPARIGGVTTIGRARNLVNAMVREPFVLHIDDDDELHPSYGEEMIGRLGSAKLAKLGTWRALHVPTGTIFEWDTGKLGGMHYALQGKDVGRVEVPAGGDQMVRDIAMLGWGFSYVYPLSTWLERKFPEEGTEDFPWARGIRDAGGQIVQVQDCAHLCMHLVHEGSPSAIFPQTCLGSAQGQKMVGAAPRTTLRSAVRERMIGSMAAMRELPSGQDIVVAPGVMYSLLVKLKDNHSLKSLSVRASSWGVTITEARDNVPASEFGVETPPGGYRLVHVVASSSKAGKLPWKVPSPLSFFDKTSVVKAWTSAPMVGAHPVLRRMVGCQP